VFSGGASSPQETGSVSAYLESDEETGGGAEQGNEFNRGRQLSGLVTWGVTDRLALSLQLPFKSSSIRERPDAEDAETSRLTGFGDLSLTADYVLWRNREVLPSSWYSLRLFGRAPTGNDRQRVDGRVDPHLQLGTGSWDVGGGFGGGHRFEWGAFYASALYRVNNQGANRYEYGDVFLANVALEAPIGGLRGAPNESTRVGLELNYRHARRDQFRDSAYRDSGGSVFYATPSFRFRLPWMRAERGPSLRLAAQIPLGDGGLRGVQHEGVVWSFGFIVPLR
jgi:hypothetical protein